jgi:hypothetical protein
MLCGCFADALRMLADARRLLVGGLSVACRSLVGRLSAWLACIYTLNRAAINFLAIVKIIEQIILILYYIL